MNQPTEYEEFEIMTNKLARMHYETDEIILEKMRNKRLEEIENEKR